MPRPRRRASSSWPISGVPRVDPAPWSLTIDGLVGRPRTSTLDELKALPKKIVEAVHQSCGSPLEPTVPTRRVANVRWDGVELAPLLAEVGIHPEARFLWSYGLDGGEFAGTSCDWFVKDLPLERLPAGDVLLAYELNGAPLPAEHGFPVRLVVPGYYGTNSVKWLWRLHFAAHRAKGPSRPRSTMTARGRTIALPALRRGGRSGRSRASWYDDQEPWARPEPRRLRVAQQVAALSASVTGSSGAPSRRSRRARSGWTTMPAPRVSIGPGSRLQTWTSRPEPCTARPAHSPPSEPPAIRMRGMRRHRRAWP